MRYLSIDLEMSGMNPGKDRILQMGAVLMNSNIEEFASFFSLIHPGLSKEKFAEESRGTIFHGLGWEDLENAPPLVEILNSFEAWLLKSNGWKKRKKLKHLILVGQSLIHDLEFLRDAYRKTNLSWPYSHTTIDLYNLTFLLFPMLKDNGDEVPRSRSLESVATYFGLSRKGEYHNSLEDARLTSCCFREIMAITKRFKFEKGPIKEVA